MHGRPRPKKGLPVDPEKQEAKRQKALLYGKLAHQVLDRRRQRRYDPESVELSARLLTLNPEVYTVWNYRREALQPILEAGDPEAVATELRLTEAALRVNPKSYATWHHRTWVVDLVKADLQHELRLVKLLLRGDERNFQAWAYWRALTKKMGLPPEQLLDYATSKIEENFSNYSAWHARSALLPAVAAQNRVVTLDQLLAAPPGGTGASPSAAIPSQTLDEEFELVKNAFFTLPEDQSGWLYHRWLLSNAVAAAQAARGGPEEVAAQDALRIRLEAEVDMCQELLQIEPDTKWPLLTLARLKEAQSQLHISTMGAAAAPDPSQSIGGSDLPGQPGTAPAANEQQEASCSGPMSEARSIYRQLADLDPMRRGYYEDAEAGRAHVVLNPERVA